MQVAIALRAYAIWLAFEKYSCWFLRRRNEWLPMQIAAKIIFISSWMNKVPARLIK